MKNKKGFTLLELLIVVLIIGILAATAMPQYRRAVLKARLSTGIPLTESLFQAEQAYYLAHNEFSNDIDALDLEVPKDDSCESWHDTDGSGYTCNWGSLNVQGNATSFVFIYPPNRAENDEDFNSYIGYLRLLRDDDTGEFQPNERYCVANINHRVANGVCLDMGGVYTSGNSYWNFYKM